MSTDRITPLPISDNPHAGDFAKAILEQLAATFGLTFEQLNGRTVGRVNRELQERSARRALDVYRREYASICAVYLIGYDPQRLLEDKR